jgi:hypothetical protein
VIEGHAATIAVSARPVAGGGFPFPGSWTGRCILGALGGIAIRAIVDECGANFFESADARRGNILDAIAREVVMQMWMRLLTLSRQRVHAGLMLGVAAMLTAAPAAGSPLHFATAGTPDAALRYPRAVSTPPPAQAFDPTA